MSALSKKYRLSTALLGVLLAMLWAGCDLNDQDPVEEDPFFEMQVSGDVSEELSGLQAQFATFVDTEVDEDGLILELVTQDQRGMSLTGRFDDVPEEGSYDILVYDEEEFEDEDNPFATLEEEALFGAFITMDEEGAMATYTTVSGFLDIHSSSEERLEGSFEFTATLAADSEDEDEEAPEVVVQGDFLAARGQVQ